MLLQTPYFVTDHPDQLPGLDFTREIKKPGEHPDFPDGAIGIYCDGNFYCIAAVPLSYLETPLPELIAELFPRLADRASYTPDDGTIEYVEWWYSERLAFEEKLRKRVDEENRQLRDKIERLESNRDAMRPYPVTAKSKQRAYFLNQYLDLLITFAHEFVAHDRPTTKGLCDKCGRGLGDRIHMRHYIEAKEHPHKNLFWYRDDND